VSFGAVTTNGVVSYPTALAVANDDLTLRPGMTATAEIVVARRANALLVPNAALRFTPPAAAGEKKSGSFVSSLMPRPPRPQAPKTAKPADGSDARRLWVLRAGTPVALAVKSGASNGRQTEIVAGPLKAGDAVITNQLAAPQP
jgi:HlyD family secretion protein